MPRASSRAPIWSKSERAGCERLPGPLLVPGVAERLAEHGLGRRDLVEDLEVLPPAQRLAERRAGGSRVVACQLHPTPSEPRHGVQHRRVERLGDRLELADARLGALEVTGGHRDLHGDGEQPRPSETVRRRLGHAAGEDAGGGLDATLRQPEERGAGAGPTGQLLGPGKGLLGPLEVAEPAPDVADLGERGGRVRHVAAQQLRAGPARLPLGLGQGTSPLEHDRPMDPTDAGEDGEGVLLRPLPRRLGPLGGSAQIAQVLAGADQAAVHLAGRVRAQAALDGEQHGLVEVPEAELPVDPRR